MNGYHTYITFDEILDFWAAERPDGPAFEQEGRITSFADADGITRQLIGFSWNKGGGIYPWRYWRENGLHRRRIR